MHPAVGIAPAQEAAPSQPVRITRPANDFKGRGTIRDGLGIVTPAVARHVKQVAWRPLELERKDSPDANMRSVWICSRNDALGNLAVMLAAMGVFGTRTGWPDMIVAAIMGGLGLLGGWQIVSQARGELRLERAAPLSVINIL
jgi:Co/Zn/Cd efflux system component